MSNFQNFNWNNESEKSTDTNFKESVLRDFLPYWPVVLLALILGIVSSRIYLSNQLTIFEISKGVLLKDEAQTTDNLLKQAVSGKSNTYIDDEMLIIRGLTVMKGAAILCNYQIQIQSESRFREEFIPIDNLPFTVKIINPEKTKKQKLNFYLNDLGELYIQKKKVSYGQIVNFNGNKFLFSKNTDIKFSKSSVYFQNHHQKSDNYFVINDLKTAAKYLSKRIRVGKDKKASIIRIFAESVSQTYGELMLASVLESYQTETQNEKRKKAVYTVDFIDNRLKFVGDDLDTVERQMESFKKSSDINVLSRESELFLEKIKEEDRRIVEIDLKLLMLSEVEKYVQGKINQVELSPSLVGLQDEHFEVYIQKLNEADLRYRSLLELNGKDNHNVRLAFKEVQIQKQSLIENVNNTRKNLLILKNEINDQFSSNNEEYNRLIKSIPAKERILLNITRQQSIKNTLYVYLLQKREEASIQMAGTLSDVRILEETESVKAIKPSRALVIFGFVFGFIFVVLVVLFLKSIRNTKIMSFGEITARTNMPIIGELMYADTISPIVLKDGSRSVISEQIRGLRTNLGFYGNTNDQKVILVTSSVPGEGKSFVSTNLAIAYAVTGKKVVLIEADLRKPNITKHFNLTRRMGLGVYLSGGANLEDILFEATEFLNLTIIPSGPIPPNPVELILNGKMELLIAELKNLYDYIIIDCPPVGLVTDAFEFSKFVDTALFIVRHRYTPRSSVKNLLNKIFVEKRFKHSAIVMNGIAMGIGKYGYGYDYSYLNYNELGNYNYMYYNDSYGYFQQNSKSNGILRKWKQVLFDPFKAFFGLKK